jgi:tetratricopeptide (TPR) repeat protein
MTLFQLLLLMVAGSIFYLFFKQLFSGNYPKRGVDFEAKLPDERIGGINRPDKIFRASVKSPSRIEELITMADEAIEKGDLLEARKAVQSALILDENNIEALRREGYLYLEDQEFAEAKAVYEKILSLDPDDDIAHDALANTLHKLGEDTAAIEHHQRAITLDPMYAAHYFNYANTLYDLKRYDEARQNYQKAYELDPEIEEAKKMMEELEGKQ